MRIEEMKKCLSAADERRLKAIYAPKVVGVQPEDTRRGICVMPDGEIRSYGIAEKKNVFRNDEAKVVYLSSRNCGLDWKLCYSQSDAVMGACVQSHLSGKYLTVVSSRTEGHKGTFARLSMEGPEDDKYREVKICDEVLWDIFQPVFLEKWNRWACTAHKVENGEFMPAVVLSDDDGESWKVVYLKSTPKHEVIWPHQGCRWENNGSEPNVVELSDGTLMLVARTSLDYLYLYYSKDGGDTWTTGEQSNFHCTLTTPFYLKLSDGRILFFWNNTRPLAEPDHAKTYPPVRKGVFQGINEDAFTNRDACHVAISEDDGKSWIGLRELFLNEIRNNADYRSAGGSISSADKSVHQFQAIELPYNKILVEFGQHEIARKIVIFDLNWLYEKSHHEDLQFGLKNLSTHMFVKSVSDCHLGDGFVGHCAWNRVSGALLLPDPEGTYGEALQICRVKDKRMVSDKQGAVWNFPAAYKGEVKLQVRVAGSGIKLNLCDHWINPTDDYVDVYSAFRFDIDGVCLEPDKWHEVTVAFDCEKGFAELRCSEKVLAYRRFTNTMPYGISYLHMQTLAEETDYKGTYIRRMDFNMIEQ